jgi:Protein of unknown function (DUF5132)
VIPGLGPALRPVVKGAVQMGYSAMTLIQDAVAEAGEQVQDMVAEVKAENEARASRRRRADPTAEAEAAAA